VPKGNRAYSPQLFMRFFVTLLPMLNRRISVFASLTGMLFGLFVISCFMMRGCGVMIFRGLVMTIGCVHMMFAG
jgi:hypothetical protein